MEIIRPFERLGKDDAGKAGGKGASLGEMTQAGILVPPGFVVLTDAFERFLAEADLNQELDTIFHTVNNNEIRTVDLASERIQALITGAKMPEDIAAEILEQFRNLQTTYVAVRSSATAEDSTSAAWAGQLDTFLNTTEETLLANVQRCWASLFTPRAIFYRFEKGMHGQKISVAVVVQKMIQSEVSGIAFSVHPVTEDYNQLIIEAGFGLGEAIVSGQVTPDSFVVEKEPRRIIDKNITYQSRALWRAKEGGNEWRELSQEEGSKPALSDEQALALAEIILHIEKHYGFPCDIEWAYEAGTFYITQSRPITTLTPKNTGGDPVSQHPNEQGTPPQLRIEYVKMGRWAMLPADQETWHTEHTAQYFKERFGVIKESLATFEFIDDFFSTMFIPVRFVELLYAQIEKWSGDDYLALEKRLLHFYGEREQLRETIPAIIASDYQKLSTDQLIDLYRRNRDWVHRIVVYDQFGWIAEQYWTPVLEQALVGLGLTKGTPDYNDALFKLIKPQEISTTLEEKRAVLGEALQIQAGAQTLADAAAKLARTFGWMPVFSFGIPWDENHYGEELRTLISRHKEDLTKEYAALESYREIRDSDFKEIVARYEIDPKKAQSFIDFGLVIDTRNEAEYLVSLCGFYLLPIYEEISRRLKLSLREVRTLFEDEIVSCLSGHADAKTLLAQKAGYVTYACLTPDASRINLVGGDAQAMIAYAEAHSRIVGSENIVDDTKGVPASPGKARGKARIISDPSMNDRVGRGDILFTFSTTVDYLPAMKNAAAIVTEVGGLTCHAAVVSREFGIPCVVGLKNAMSDFKDGDMVEVDADNGVVRKI